MNAILRRSVIGVLVFVPRALTLAVDPPRLGNPTPGAGATLQDFIYLLIDIMQWVILPLLALAIIYAGFTLVTAGGDPQKITKGKLWLLSTLIGAAVVLSARVIAGIVFGTASLFN